MTAATAAGRWLPSGSQTGDRRLFCFPHAGGSATAFAPWKAEARVAVCPVQPPGRAERGRETPFDDVEALADAIVADLGDEITADDALFGHSVGALVAYVVARRLVERGGPVPAHLFVSGRAAPHLPDTRRKLRSLPVDDLVVELRALGGLPEVLLSDRDLLEMFLPVMRADLAVNETYTHVPGPLLPLPLTVLGGHGDPRADEAELAAWQELATDTELHLWPGGHFYLESRAAEVLAVVHRRLGT